MTDEIVFYHNPQSRAQMVHWMLEEAGAPYRIVPIDFEKGEHKSAGIPGPQSDGQAADHRASRHGGDRDGGDHRLSRRHFPAAGLAPAIGRPARGAYYRWLFFGAGCFEPALLDKMMKRPEVERKGGRRLGQLRGRARRHERPLAKGPICSARSSPPPTSMWARRSAWR